MSRDSMVRVFSPGKRSRVRGIQHHGEVVKSAGPGERVALALSDVDVAEVARGSVVIAESSWPVTTRIEADVRLIGDVAIGPRTRLRFHLGTSDVGARISRRIVEGFADERHFIGTIVLDEPLLARGRDRFVLRLASPAATVGGGVVRDPLPRRKKKRRAPSSISARNTNELLDEMTEDAGLSGLRVEHVPIRLGLAPGEAARVEREIGLTEIDSRLYHAKILEDLELTVQRLILAHVENFPLEPGVQLQSLRSTAGAPDRVIDRILDQLAKKGAIEIRQSSVRPAGWSPSLSSRERALAEAITHRICITPTEPPSVAELADVFGEKVDDVLRYLERSGELVRVSGDRYYSRGAVDEMIGKLRLALEPGRIYSPAELREVLGVSRKYLIPFLEFCDVKGVTIRKAEGRVITGKDVTARPGRQ